MTDAGTMSDDYNRAAELRPPGHRLTRRLAVGFSSEIWECEVTIAGCAPLPVAISIAHRAVDKLTESAQIQRIRWIAGLSDVPGIPRVHALGHCLGRLYVMTPLATGDCSSLIRKEPLTSTGLTEVLHIIDRTSITIDALHERGFIHGSISPQHILIGQDGPTLTGFSSMRQCREQVSHRRPIDLMTQICMSPEMNASEANLRSDQYSLAATYLTIRLGVLPSFDDSWPHAYIPRLDRHEGQIITKALSPLPQHRFGTCLELANELRGAICEDGFGNGAKGDLSN
jgi:serine/threonine protein kinase